MPRLLIAFGLSALLWATASPSPGFGAASSPSPGFGAASSPSPGFGAASSPSQGFGGATACAVDGDSHGPNDSDRQWQNAHHAIAVVTESQWKSSPVHAGLGATRVARMFERARFVSSPDPPAAATPSYLRHTPLLI